jgi:L-iditol 2-dehydrogenase
LITGLGPVGLGGVINARYRGARVIGVDSNPWRAERASLLGAEAVLDPGAADIRNHILELTEGRGVDKAVDCSGAVAAQRLCIDSVKRRGAVAFVGESTADLPFRISPDMIRKGLTLVGSWHYNLKHTPKIMNLIAHCGVDLDLLISHHFSLCDVQKAWELQASGQCAKVLLHPWMNT